MEKRMTEIGKQQITVLNAVLSAACVLMLAIFAGRSQANPAASSAGGKIFAQALVEGVAAKHPELAGLELATTPTDKRDCITIAATDAKEMGDKCDKAELAVMRTGKATVEKERDGYDVTVPLHVGGKTIGIVGLDFKLDQQESGLLNRAEVIAKEVEDQVPVKSKLFESAE
jgi:hypothetical protein